MIRHLGLPALAVPVLALLALAGCASDPSERAMTPPMEVRPATMSALQQPEWRVLAAVPHTGDAAQAARFVGAPVVISPEMWRDHRGRTCPRPSMTPRAGRASDLLGPEGALADHRRRAGDGMEIIAVGCDGVHQVDLAVWGPDQLVARDGDLLLFLEPSRGEIMTPIPIPVVTPVAAIAAPATGRGMHLVSDRTEAAARAAWRRFEGRPGFDRLQPRTVAVDLPGKGRMVRLFAVGADADMRRACDALKAGRQYCMMMDLGNRAVR